MHPAGQSIEAQDFAIWNPQSCMVVKSRLLPAIRSPQLWLAVRQTAAKVIAQRTPMTHPSDRHYS
eukprot:scaffold29662_cov17-Prasinocladus_malaysianus.AAC.1